jgi:hypothetical protein
MAREYWGPVTTLHEAAVARVDVWVFCLACGRANWFVPKDLAEKLQKVRPGDAYVAHFKLSELTRYLRCTKCGAKSAVVHAKSDPPRWMER